MTTDFMTDAPRPTNKIVTCGFCGKMHGVRCPEVKALEYYPSGNLKRVEYMTPGDYPSLVSGLESPFGVPTTRVPNT